MIIVADVCNSIASLSHISFCVASLSSVAARNARITPSIKVRPGEATKCIEEFRDGTINILVSTSVIEEGFDVPEANVVISYDYLKDTVVSSELSLLFLVHINVHRLTLITSLTGAITTIWEG